LLTKEDYHTSLGLRLLDIASIHWSQMALWLKQSLRRNHLNLIAAETTSHAHQKCVGGERHLLANSLGGLCDVANSERHAPHVP